MTAPLVVVVLCEQLGPVTTGHWCGRCALPSAASMTCAVSVGRAPTGVLTVTACLDCGRTVTS